MHIERPALDEVYLRKIQKAKITPETNSFLLEPEVLDIIK